MKKNYFILVLTFLCILWGQWSYGQIDENGGELGEVIIENPYTEPCFDCSCDSFFCGSGSSCYECYCDSSFCDPNENDPCISNPALCYPDDPYTDPSIIDTVTDPCTSELTTAGTAITNLLKDDNVKSSLNNLPILTPSTPPFSPQNEFGFTIKNINGNITTTATNEGTANGLLMTGYTNHTIADVHTHPDPGAYAPSAQDLLALDHKHDLMPDFNTMYIISPDGSKYALYINDVSKLNDFMNNNSGFVGSDNNFAAGTASGDFFRSTIRDLLQLGYSTNEAYERATTLVLNNSGVTLYKSSSIPDDFKKIGLEKQTDENGKNTYEKINCN